MESSQAIVNSTAYYVRMTDRGTPTPQEVAESTVRGLASYNLLRWQQGLRGGRFVAEGLGVRIDKKGSAQAEIITYSPDSGLQVAPVSIRKIGGGDAVYQRPEAPEAAGIGSGVIK